MFQIFFGHNIAGILFFRNDLQVLIKRIVDVKPGDLGPRRHDLAYAQVIQFKNVFDHFLLADVKYSMQPALLQQYAHFFFRDRRFVTGLKPQRLQ